MPAPECNLLHEWLRRTAAARPHATAIEEDGRATSFESLFGRAAALARSFLAHGLRPGDRVALVLPKTTEAVVAVFASLLAGAAYVPIHPRWPQARRQAVLDDCAARLLIDEENGRLRVVDRATGDSTLLAEFGADGGDAEQWPRVDPAATAVLLFTSGSTGLPKGVVLSHRAVAAFVGWTATEFRMTAQDRIATPAPLGFDLSTFDLFNMALTGATAVLVPENIAWMPRFLARFVREARIHCWYSVPSILASLLDEECFAHSDLRLILFAGESLAPAALARLRAAAPGARCVNLYGPTETNVVTWYDVPRNFQPSDPLPIGRPCPYAEIAVDPVSGELLAGGASQMDGYWNRPEETARAFATIEGRRFYRTGDRVSLAADGNYLFHGRLDRQIKRRGFRIELDEIEAALLRHSQLAEAAVVAVRDAADATLIVAFVCPRRAKPPSLAALRAHCALQLPPYMLPDRIVFVDILKKGNRGKIDYSALAQAAALTQAAEGHVRGD